MLDLTAVVVYYNSGTCNCWSHQANYRQVQLALLRYPQSISTDAVNVEPAVYPFTTTEYHVAQ